MYISFYNQNFRKKLIHRTKIKCVCVYVCMCVWVFNNHRGITECCKINTHGL